MSFSFTFHDDLHLVYKRVWGSYGDEDSTAAHAFWDSVNSGKVGQYDELQDLTAVTDYRLSIEKMRALALHYQNRFDARICKKIAYVAPNDAAFGTGRVYSSEVVETELNFNVFRSLAEAAAWLGLSDDQLSQVLEGNTQPELVSD